MSEWKEARHLEKTSEGPHLIDCTVRVCGDPTHHGGTIHDSAAYLDAAESEHMLRRHERVIEVSEGSQRELLLELHVLRKQRDELQSRMSAMVVERQGGYAAQYKNAVNEAAIVVEESKDLFPPTDTSDGFTTEENHALDRASLVKRIRALAVDR